VATPDIRALLERRVATLKKSRADLAEALDLQAALIRESLASPRSPETQPFPLPREHLVTRVRNGVPLLHDQPVFIDIQFAGDLFSRLVNLLQQRDDADLAGRLDALASAALSGALDPERLFGEAFVHHSGHLAEIAAPMRVDAELLITLATQSVAPLLRAYSQRLTPLIEAAADGTLTGAEWTRGYCPICGGWPLLGELRGVELARWLRCIACGSGWRTQRLRCPYCGNDDYRTLGSLAVEGEVRQRIEVCERCKGYLKVVNAFDPPPAELLAIEDVASMHLDIVAIDRGYQRPGGNGFSIELALPDSEWVEELA
jgi:FdhE protein